MKNAWCASPSTSPWNVSRRATNGERLLRPELDADARLQAEIALQRGHATPLGFEIPDRHRAFALGHQATGIDARRGRVAVDEDR